MSVYKKSINWNKYQSAVSIQTQNQYLDYLIAPIFEKLNTPFVLKFEDSSVGREYTEYFLILQRKMQAYCNRSKQATRTRC